MAGRRLEKGRNCHSRVVGENGIEKFRPVMLEIGAAGIPQREFGAAIAPHVRRTERHRVEIDGQVPDR